MFPNDRATPEATERAYPHVVEMHVPEGRFSPEIDAMLLFHARHGIQIQHGRSRHENGRDYIRWCFADAGVALPNSRMSLAAQSANNTRLDT
ncbi:MAG: hypothetical protein WCD62_22505 [Pseudolabrys sp.]